MFRLNRMVGNFCIFAPNGHVFFVFYYLFFQEYLNLSSCHFENIKFFTVMKQKGIKYICRGIQNLIENIDLKILSDFLSLSVLL